MMRILDYLDGRSTEEVIQRDILQNVKNNYKHITSRINTLIEFELVREDEIKGNPTKIIYMITEKGQIFIEKVRELNMAL